MLLLPPFEEHEVASIVDADPNLQQLYTERQFIEQLKKLRLPRANTALLPVVIQQDLGVVYGFPDLGINSDISFTYEIGRALRDQVGARGNPTIVEISESVVRIAQAAIAVGYTVPLQRQAKVFLATAAIINGLAPQNNQGQFGTAEILFIPAGGTTISIAAQPVQAVSNFTTGESKMLTKDAAHFMAAGDILRGRVFVDTTVAPGADFRGGFHIFAIETDIGFGFADW